jgi:putative inorganic carbon (HCO3(-)) transporter
MSGNEVKAALLRIQTLSPNLVWIGLLVVAAVLLTFLPLTAATLLFGGVALLVLTVTRPHYALYLLAFAIPFGSVREISIGPAALGGAEAVALLVVAVWLLRVIALRETIAWRSPLTWALLGFLFVGLLSALGALSIADSAKEFLRWAELLVIFVAARNLLTGRRALIAASFLLAGAALEGLLGAYQFLQQVGPPGFVLMGQFMRAYGTFDQPNPYAGYLGLLLPLSVALLLARWRDWKSAVRAPWQRALLWIGTLLATGLALMGIAMSWSRGAWITVAVSMVALVLLKGRKWALAILALIVIGWFVLGSSAAGLLPSAISERFADVVPFFTPFDVRTVEVTDANWSLVERMAHWQAAWGMFSDHPWLGVGFGNYPAVYPAYAIGIWTDPLGHAHNYYLNVAAEAGLVGLSAYLLVIAAAFVQSLRAFSRTSGLQRAVVIGALGMLVYLCVHNLVDNLYVHGLNILVGMMLGMAWALAATADAAKPRPLPRGAG